MKRFILFTLIITCIVTFSAAEAAGNTPFREEGIASWYGREFEGRPTASGEIFNPGLFTAAHRTLPFGTLLTVTNTLNMRQVNVRINDRGPFVAARIIDLSETAAAAIDMLNAGTVPVIITQTDNVALGPVAPTAPSIPSFTPPPAEIIPRAGTTSEPAGAPAPAPNTPVAGTFFPAPPARIMGGIPPADSTGIFRIQVGAFRIPGNAVETFDKLRSAGLNSAFYEQSGEFIRVVLTGLRAQDIPQIAQSLGNLGYPEVIIRQEN